jgi:hypothetical protein
MATRPEPTQARPTAGTYTVPSSLPSTNPPAPHAAFDGMDTPPDVTGADGDMWADLPDH